jgi:hypothetical protein
MEFAVTRTQYPFDLSGVRCKSRGDITVMQRQWDTFERVENYNNIVFQRIQHGYRDRLYYQFANRQELSDYNVGQQQHILRYPWISSIEFCSYSQKPITNSTIITPAPMYVQIARSTQFSTSVSASEKTEQIADLATYMYVSSYNSQHTYKYIFTSAEERLAYHRAERQILAPK